MTNNIQVKETQKEIPKIPTLRHAENTFWKWRGNPTTFGKMGTEQLISIKKGIQVNPGRRWFNHNNSDILAKIQVIEAARLPTSEDYTYQGNEKFLKDSLRKAHKMCDILMPIIERGLSPDLREKSIVNPTAAMVSC